MATGNSVNDEIKEQHRLVREEKTFKEKLAYFFYYYKMHVLVTALIIFGLSYLIYTYATQKETVFQVAYINGFPNVDKELFMDEYTKTIEFDPKKQEVILDDSFYIDLDNMSMLDEQSAEKIYILASAGELDACVVDETYFEVLAEGGYLLNLENVLSAQQKETYQDKFFYYDSSQNLYEGEELVGIEVTDAAKIVSTESFPNSKAYFCIIVNSEYVDNALAYLEYLYTP